MFIFFDTDDKSEQDCFAERFYNILKAESDAERPADIGMRAKNAISLYTERLESQSTGNRIFSGGGVSVICTDDSELSLSYMFRNVWIKRLPRHSIITKIKPHRGHLQTVGLICPDSERAGLSEIFARAGAVRITRGGEMSRVLAGEAHDGTYALREYSRIVETEK